MGWSFDVINTGRKAFIERLTSPGHFSSGYTKLAHRIVGNHVWQAVRIDATGRVFVTLDLIAKDRDGGWGYKGMSEDSGPYYFDCPLSLLDMCTEPESENGAAWREKVREYHRKRKTIKPVMGMVVECAGQKYELYQNAGQRRGWYVRMVGGSGMLYRMSAATLNRCLMA